MSTDNQQDWMFSNQNNSVEGEIIFLQSFGDPISFANFIGVYPHRWGRLDTYVTN